MFFILFLISAIYYLWQITTWTIPSFRKSIVIRKYIVPFSDQIPENILDQEIICKNIIFKFESPNAGLFRAHPLGRIFRNRRNNYFPTLLGEIKLDPKGVAQITLRIPFPIISMTMILFFALVVSITGGALTADLISTRLPQVVFAVLIFGFLALVSFIMETDDLKDSVMILKDRAKSDSFSQTKYK